MFADTFFENEKNTTKKISNSFSLVRDLVIVCICRTFPRIVCTLMQVYRLRPQFTSLMNEIKSVNFIHASPIAKEKNNNERPFENEKNVEILTSINNYLTMSGIQRKAINSIKLKRIYLYYAIPLLKSDLSISLCSTDLISKANFSHCFIIII